MVLITIGSDMIALLAGQLAFIYFVAKLLFSAKHG